MKAIKIIFLLVLMANVSFSCTGQTKESKNTSVETVKPAEDVKVYYFHMSRRCYTCKKVEKAAKNAVQDLENENVSFTAFNIEKAEGKAKAKELGIAGQTLLITGGDKKYNITRQGFLNVRQPEKLKKIINQKVNSIL